MHVGHRKKPVDDSMMCASVHHIAVVVADLARSEAFYRTLLDIPVQAKAMKRWQYKEGAERSVWLALDGGAFLAIERAEASIPVRVDLSPGWHCVAFAIAKDQRPRTRQRLALAGISIERESAYSIFVRDPDFNLVSLSHYPDEADAP
ncbi:MAG: hypothetical protein NVSMB1_06320 [Polyangiales bacterium]